MVPTIAALRERGDEIVRRVLAENEGRWESLSEADRERLSAMAKAIASRLLHEPTLRMKRSAGSDEAYLYVSALRELFGLDAETEPEAEGAASQRRPSCAARPQSRPGVPGRLRIATRGSALALAQAGQVAEMLGGAELVEVSSDGEPGDKARFVRGVERALLEGEAEIGVHSAKDLPAELTEGLMLAAVPAREDAGRRLDRRRRRRSTRCPRAPGSAPRACGGAPSCSPPGPTSRWASCTATSTPGCASSRRASSTRSCSPSPGCAGWGARTRSPSRSRPRR